VIFHSTEPDAHCRELRLVSAGGGWALGMTVYHSGTRLRMGHSGKPPSVFDFCMGTDPALYGGIFEAVLHCLEPLEEGSTREEIDAVFPWAGTRPDLAVHLEALLDPSISHVRAGSACT